MKKFKRSALLMLIILCASLMIGCGDETSTSSQYLKDSDEYKIALRFMSQEDLLKDDIDNIRLLVKDDGEDYMYFIINENTDYIGGGACGEEMITKYETINQDIILYYGFSEEDKIKQTNRYKIYISMWQDN